MHTLRRSSPKGLAGKEPACKCSTANVYVHVYFLRLYIFTFKRAIYRYFLANFARIDVIMIIFEKNKAMENLFGRQEEIAELTRYYESGKAEFVAIYGRRRVGKTFLIDSLFDGKYAFSTSGIIGGTQEEEMAAFTEDLRRYGYKGQKPRSWMKAFEALRTLLESKLVSGKRMVIFIDELPCLATPKSSLVKAIDRFWNNWAGKHKEIFLIVCGSATSWIIRNIIDDKGGLHNRITHEKHLFPFTLGETRDYLHKRGFTWTDISILQAYMILGGVPFYLDLLERNKSLPENIDALFFGKDAQLSREFDRLYKSIFNTPEKYKAVIKALATSRKGMTRAELATKLKVNNNGHFGDILEDLVNCDFIRYYNILGKTVRSTGGLYQLTDFYSIFHQTFLTKHITDAHYWSATLNNPVQNTWYGLAFERVAMSHIPQILKAIGVDRILTQYYSWRSAESPKGAQVDLVIDRADGIINLCEVKYSTGEYSISKDEFMKLSNRSEVFRRESGTKKGIFLTLITTYGLSRNGYSDIANNTITMADLFL